jgi:hypothetical protein
MKNIGMSGFKHPYFAGKKVVKGLTGVEYGEASSVLSPFFAHAICGVGGPGVEYGKEQVSPVLSSFEDIYRKERESSVLSPFFAHAIRGVGGPGVEYGKEQVSSVLSSFEDIYRKERESSVLSPFFAHAIRGVGGPGVEYGKAQGSSVSSSFFSHSIYGGGGPGVFHGKDIVTRHAKGQFIPCFCAAMCIDADTLYFTPSRTSTLFGEVTWTGIPDTEDAIRNTAIVNIANQTKNLEFFHKIKDILIAEHSGKVAVIAKGNHIIAENSDEAIKLARAKFSDEEPKIIWEIKEEEKIPRIPRLGGIRRRTLRRRDES